MDGAGARDGRADRAAYRAFLRANHPDRGGDPDVFVAGIARWRRMQSVTEARRRDRYDGPVVFVDDGRGAARFTAAVRRWRERRRRWPRVH